MSIWWLIKSNSLKKVCDALLQNIFSASTFMSRPDDRLRTRALVMRETGEIPQGTLIFLQISHRVPNVMLTITSGGSLEIWQKTLKFSIIPYGISLFSPPRSFVSRDSLHKWSVPTNQSRRSTQDSWWYAFYDYHVQYSPLDSWSHFIRIISKIICEVKNLEVHRMLLQKKGHLKWHSNPTPPITKDREICWLLSPTKNSGQLIMLREIA